MPFLLQIVLDVQGAPLLTACSSAAASQTPHFSLWECVYHHTKGSTEIIRDGWTLNLTLLFNGITGKHHSYYHLVLG